MYILVTTVIGAVLFAGGIFVLDRIFKAKKGASVGKDVAVFEEQVGSLTSAIEKSLSYVEEMQPLENAKDLESQIEGLERELAGEREKLAKLDKQVEALQSSVEAEEAQHGELKRGKDEATALANEIRSRQDEMGLEYNRLENELEQSLAQLSALSGEISLNPEQKSALKKITTAMEKSREQLTVLVDLHTQARNRFLSLETQYAELEREFTKLVEKELSGEA